MTPEELKEKAVEAFKGPANPTEVSVAALFGAASGFASKKVSKTAAFFVGLTFMGLQGLSHAKVITINWDSLEKMAIEKLDADGDGKLDSKDLQLYANRFVHNLSNDIPSSASFIAGFWLGFRYG
ncbi:hypothetical protein HDV04_002038 [Boothiomyces sp. JEL0838]|nr:hypothetical protein HDV04_002038 [Boothiomyces sp. JEL0838]